MPIVRRKHKFQAERWISTNTTQIVEWVRRGGKASIRWYPFYEMTEQGLLAPDWMQIPEHLIIADERAITTVAPYMWILRDEEGHYSVISDEEYRSEFEPTF